jgi:hypothetical protein
MFSLWMILPVNVPRAFRALTRAAMVGGETVQAGFGRPHPQPFDLNRLVHQQVKDVG